LHREVAFPVPNLVVDGFRIRKAGPKEFVGSSAGSNPDPPRSGQETAFFLSTRYPTVLPRSDLSIYSGRPREIREEPAGDRYELVGLCKFAPFK
jgi:hypothetical protein